MGRRTRTCKELFLNSIKSSTRNSLYEIKNSIDKLNICSHVNVYFNIDGSIKKIKTKKIKCNIDACDKFVQIMDILLMILLCMTVFGIVLVLTSNRRRRCQHIILNFHQVHNKNIDQIVQISRFFNEYYNASYCLISKNSSLIIYLA